MVVGVRAMVVGVSGGSEGGASKARSPVLMRPSGWAVGSRRFRVFHVLSPQTNRTSTFVKTKIGQHYFWKPKRQACNVNAGSLARAPPQCCQPNPRHALAAIHPHLAPLEPLPSAALPPPRMLPRAALLPLASRAASPRTSLSLELVSHHLRFTSLCPRASTVCTH